MMTVPVILQALRKKLRLTQTELAEKLGVAYATLNRWENGHRAPQNEHLVAITILARQEGVLDEKEELLQTPLATPPADVPKWNYRRNECLYESDAESLGMDGWEMVGFSPDGAAWFKKRTT